MLVVTSKTPFMPIYVADYFADTRHLRAAEHGAYMLLLMTYWQNGRLPTDDSRLAHIACMRPQEWAKAKPVIAAFFDLDWKHKRVEADIVKATLKAQRRAECGSLGGFAKALKNNNAALAKARDLPQQIVGTELPSSSEFRDLSKDKSLGEKKSSEKFSKTKPSPISPSWEPSENDFSVLAEAGVTAREARGRVVSFRNYWLQRAEDNPRDAKAKKSSWGRTFQNHCLELLRRGQITASFDSPEQNPNSLPMFYAKRDTPQWAEWQNWYFKTKGKSAPTDKNGGWHFPSEWPPKVQEAAE